MGPQNKIELVQNRAMLTISGCVKSTSNTSLRHYLGLPSLILRRNVNRIGLLYKILKGLAPNYLHEILDKFKFPERTNRRDKTLLRIPTFRKSKFKSNFFFDAITSWNKLPAAIRCLTGTPKCLKTAIYKFKNCPIKLSLRYFYGDRRLEMLFNRLLLSFTTLKADLFRHNIVPDPQCDCGEANETPHHYLFECSYYTRARQKLIRNLRQIPDLINLPFNQFRKCYTKLIQYMHTNTDSSDIAVNHVQTFIQETNRFDSTT